MSKYDASFVIKYALQNHHPVGIHAKSIIDRLGSVPSSYKHLIEVGGTITEHVRSRKNYDIRGEIPTTYTSYYARNDNNMQMIEELVRINTSHEDNDYLTMIRDNFYTYDSKVDVDVLLAYSDTLGIDHYFITFKPSRIDDKFVKKLKLTRPYTVCPETGILLFPLKDDESTSFHIEVIDKTKMRELGHDDAFML